MPFSLSPYLARDELHGIYKEKSISSDTMTAPTKEGPLPDWIIKAVQKGTDTFAELEKAMRVGP